MEENLEKIAGGGDVVAAAVVDEERGDASGHVGVGGGPSNAYGSSSLTSSYEGGLVTSGVNTPEKVRWRTYLSGDFEPKRGGAACTWYMVSSLDVL